MDRLLYISMSGAKQTMTAQSIAANNLANISTNGFRAQLARMSSVPVEGEGYASRVYAQTQEPETDFSHGPIMTTGNELDVAINGDGWMAVQLPNGNEGYTRAGSLRISPIGSFLVTAEGYPVLGNGGPISVPQIEKMEISGDGTISILPVGQDPNTLVTLDRIRLVNPPKKDLFRGSDGLFRHRNNELAITDANITLVSGALETSNVNGVQAMVDMIALARAFETQVKMMKVADENDSTSARLMQIS